jgi:4-oxalocrotonate tautomerase
VPYLDIKLSGPCLPDNIKKLAACMTDLAVHILNKDRDVTAATIHCVPPGHWSIGGDSIAECGQTTFFLEINVTSGTNTADEKHAFVAAAFKTAEGIFGKLADASYVVVREVAADAWGYRGVTQQARRLQRTQEAAA